MRFMHWDRTQLATCHQGHFREIAALMNEQGRDPSADPVTTIE